MQRGGETPSVITLARNREGVGRLPRVRTVRSKISPTRSGDSTGNASTSAAVRATVITGSGRSWPNTATDPHVVP